jgi:transposase
MARPRFKPYLQTQAFLIPPSLDELIDANHPVRIVSAVIDSIDIDALLKKYKDRGTTSYNPRMLLKVLVYGYLNNIYSSRKLEAVLKENIHFMWISGMSTPDHHTINRFRSERLKHMLEHIFSKIVVVLVDSGYVSLKEVYTDGTKIESVANRYSFVWGRAIQTSKERIKKQLRELWAYSQKVARQERKDDEPPPTFDNITPELISETIEQIDAALKEQNADVPQDIKQKLAYAKKQWPDKLREYERKEQVLGTRNSYSKTDTDATFMRMKEDHMKNGQLKPGYNVQISTNNQFIVNYSIHQNPTDTKTLIPHNEQHKQLYGNAPEVQVADAGYGSEQNYQYLDEQGTEAYIKHNYFDKEQKKNHKPKYPFAPEYLHYNKDKDQYICPMGQPMKCVGEHQEQTGSFIRTYKHYQAANCNGCPMRGACHKQQGNRKIQVSHEGNRLKKQAAERLKTETGTYHRKKRCWDTEPVFGNIKHNKNFKRFRLKGVEKVAIEWGLLSIAHNLSKVKAVAKLKIKENLKKAA